ncbi:hypothetical protein JCM15124A_03410 [Prevotella falsenii]
MQAQSVNMERYITLNVNNGATIQLRFCSDAADTKIKVVTGESENTLTIGNDWTDVRSYTAKANTLTVYGDVSKFNCSANLKGVTGVDASHNEPLQELVCSRNNITSLDISKNTELTVLTCNNCQLTSLDLTQNTKLVKLDCKENALTSLDVSKNKQLGWLNCFGNAITSLDLTNNTELESLFCFRNAITKLDVSKNEKLIFLSCHTNKLTSLDVSKNIKLKNLGCHTNKISSLDVTNNKELTSLDCYENALTSLDITKNKELTYLDCANNSLTTLDVSYNDELKIFNFFANKFNTDAIDAIFCALPDRTGEEAGKARPLYNGSSSERTQVLAANDKNVTVKNWNVEYYDEGTEITGFTGTRECGGGSEVNMSRYITITVKKDADIKLDLMADAADTKVKVVNGSDEQIITVNNEWTGPKPYNAKAGTITVYGNIWQFNCSDNAANVTGVDASNNAKLQVLICNNDAISSLNVSGNTGLIGLYCVGNKLTTLDISKNLNMQNLYCYENSLATLDVSKNTNLAYLDCHSNKLTELDLSHNLKLASLNCRSNKLTALDVSNNEELEWLYCFENSLTNLDVNNNLKLNSLYCYGNKFTSAALDNLYCSLPDRKGEAIIGLMQPLLNSSSPDKATVLATNGSNAANKNWLMSYYEDDSEITGFTGTHKCTDGIDQTEEATSDFTVYPNPVKDVLKITSDKPIHSIRIYNASGEELLHATDTNSINVSHLPTGIYMVYVDGKVTRIIKE